MTRPQLSTRRFPGMAARALAVTAVALAASAGSAQAQMLVGLTSSNELARFDVSNPGAATTVAISGLAAGDRFVGIDLRPSNNMLYGITLSNQIYTINEMTGAASFVAALNVPVVAGNLGWGLDFNPVADFAGAASLRVVSSAGANLAVNVNNGMVGNTASNIGPGFTGVGYTNSTPAGAPASTGLYYINTDNNTLAFTPTGFNAPVISTIGALGINPVSANGFEVLSNGMAYAAFNLENSAALTTGIYGINLATGAATLAGTFNGTLSGLTVSAVPEPGTYGLLLAGLGVLAWVARRRSSDNSPSRATA
jgi:hypothetical protein